MAVFQTSRLSVNDAGRRVIDNSRVILQILASLIDDSRDISYIYEMFIAQVTGHRKTLMACTIKIYTVVT